MQGVNLPAKNIIIRNPNLFVRKGESSAKLSPYEFANLRGRAGRLLTDFVGRTIVPMRTHSNRIEKKMKHYSRMNTKKSKRVIMIYT